MPNLQPLKPHSQNDKWSALIAVACILWTAGMAWLSISVAGSVTIVALIFATLLLVLLGKYHPSVPKPLTNFSKAWLKHWKYTVTILALAAAGLPIGRIADRMHEVQKHEKVLFDAMRPAEHLASAERAKNERDLSRARRHLAAIPSSAQEAQAAADLLAQIDPEVARAKQVQQQENQASAERAKRDAELKQFNEMTPVQHIEAAQKALAIGYDRKERIGGDLEEAEKHLAVIPEGSKESKLSEKLQNEIDERKKKTAIVWYRGERKDIADKLDQAFIKAGINVDSVQAAGKENTILRVNYALCSRVFFDRMTPPEVVAGWRAKGFKRVECRSFDQGISLDLN